MLLLSGDQAAPCPSRLPNRRGVPPSTGTVQKGPSSDVPRAVFIISSDRSGEISKTFAKLVSSNEVATGKVSPPVTEVCERRDRPWMKYSREPSVTTPDFGKLVFVSCSVRSTRGGGIGRARPYTR